MYRIYFRALVYCLLSLGLAPTTLWATTMNYIDPSCTNDGNGTGESCAGSPGGVGAYNTWASVTFASDNTYAQKAGTTWTISANQSILITASGASDSARIILTRYGTGADPIINATGNHYGIAITGARSFITLDHFEVYGVSMSAGSDNGLVRLCDSAGVFCTSITITNMTLHDAVSAGGGSSAQGIMAWCTSCIITDNTIYNIANDAINVVNVGSGNTVISRNIVQNVSTSSVFGDGFQLSGTAATVTMIDNYCDHTSVEIKHCLIDQTTTTTSYYANNKFLMSTLDAPSGTTYAVELDGPTGIVVGNILRGGHVCLQTSNANYVIYGNLLTGCYGFGWVFSGTNNTATFSNNTIDPTSFTGIIAVDLSGSVANTVGLYNNAITNAGTGVKKAGSVTVIDRNNLFFGNTANGSSYSPDASSVLADPLYINRASSDYRTQGTSPARRAGLSGYPCLDVRGRACYPDRPDIGAYQATSGDPASTRSAASARGAASARSAASTRTAR